MNMAESTICSYYNYNLRREVNNSGKMNRAEKIICSYYNYNLRLRLFYCHFRWKQKLAHQVIIINNKTLFTNYKCQAQDPSPVQSAVSCIPNALLEVNLQNVQGVPKKGGNFQSFEDKNSNILLYALCFAFMILDADAEHIVQCVPILKYVG